MRSTDASYISRKLSELDWLTGEEWRMEPQWKRAMLKAKPRAAANLVIPTFPKHLVLSRALSCKKYILRVDIYLAYLLIIISWLYGLSP